MKYVSMILELIDTKLSMHGREDLHSEKADYNSLIWGIESDFRQIMVKIPADLLFFLFTQQYILQ